MNVDVEKGGSNMTTTNKNMLQTTLFLLAAPNPGQRCNFVWMNYVKKMEYKGKRSTKGHLDMDVMQLEQMK